MHRFFLVFFLLCVFVNRARAAVIFETTSPYHHIRVIDEGETRKLSFDGAVQTTMSRTNHLQGHAQYTEFFVTPWLFRGQITNVLMVGLGGGSIQRAWQHHFPEVMFDTVEIDPAVVQVAKTYFDVKESPAWRIFTEDGRVHLRRSTRKYDAIFLDAYVANRYGSFLPYHLATQEFFQLARDHLTTNGLVACNVIGTLDEWQADIVGALFKTLHSVFPQVYLFPSGESANIVLIATKSAEKFTAGKLQQRAVDFVGTRRIALPALPLRAAAIRVEPPASYERSPILTDDYAPVDGLVHGVTPATSSPSGTYDKRKELGTITHD